MSSIPTHMNAIVLEKEGAPSALQKVPVPTPGPTQVLIKVDSSPINPSDIMFIGGYYGETKPFPSIAGFEGSGTVVSDGPLSGKRVSFMTGSNSGSYADYAVAETYMCNPVSDNVSDLSTASSGFINPVTVIGFLDVVQKANVKAIVHTAAASQLGKMLIRFFKDNGIQVINVVRRQDQADMIKKVGAEHILNSSDPDFLPKLTELAAKLNATICFEAVGGELTGQILSALPNKSTVYNYGCLSGQPCAGLSALDLIFKEKTLTGFWLNTWLATGGNKLKDCQVQIQKMQGSQLKTDTSKEFSLEQFDEAVKFYQANQSLGKTLIRPKHSQ